jgi:hypothetical protein
VSGSLSSWFSSSTNKSCSNFTYLNLADWSLNGIFSFTKAVSIIIHLNATVDKHFSVIPHQTAYEVSHSNPKFRLMIPEYTINFLRSRRHFLQRQLAPLMAVLGNSFSAISILDHVTYLNTFIFIPVPLTFWAIFHENGQHFICSLCICNFFLTTLWASCFPPQDEQRRTKVIHQEFLPGIAAASTIKAKI